MSTPYLSGFCRPGGEPIRWFGADSAIVGYTPEPRHEKCPGGSNTPGLIGGWTCPCDCHRLSAPARVQTGEDR